MAEDRTKADIIKSTFSVRAVSLRLLQPPPKGDGTLTIEEFDSLYGILWEVCEYFCALAVTEPDRVQRFPDYNTVTGQVVVPLVDGDDRVWLLDADALAARRRKIQWLIGKAGLPVSRLRQVLQRSVSRVERIQAIRDGYGDHPVNGVFRGNPDDLSPFDFEAL